MQFQEDPPPQGLSEAWRDSAVFANILPTLIRRGGTPSETAGFIANNYEVRTFHYAHLYSLFSWEILTLFFSTLLEATAHNASASAAVASLLER